MFRISSLRRASLFIGRFASLAIFVCFVARAPAQSGLQPLSGFGTNSAGGLGADAPMVKASGFFTAPAAGKPAMLAVAAEIEPGWHIYSITQAAGGPIQTKIKIGKSSELKLAGDFKAVEPPKAHRYPEIWPNLSVEEQDGRVTWIAPIELAPGVDPAKLEIAGAVYAQVCTKNA